ncbi:MAG: hypothetical protein K1X53_10365 [Candidatus Sumerlaeaceae bacterium]|nr:hypothetical protein [Candidatus Sumerlaeaceae bacterium]
MKRQEILLNLTLLTAIGALTFLIFSEGEDLPSLPSAPANLASNSGVGSKTETSFVPAATSKKFDDFGNKEIFRAIMTPTPTPPPATPKPSPTPNISVVLGNWKLSSVDGGEATIEDKTKANNPDGAFFTMKVGEAHPVEVDKGVMGKAVLKKIDESGDTPSVSFELDPSTGEVYKISM